MADRIAAVAAHLSTSSSPALDALKWSASLPPGRVTSSHHSRSTLVVQWEGYHTMACRWGYRRDDANQPLFLGFTDGAANIMVVPNPTCPEVTGKIGSPQPQPQQPHPQPPQPQPPHQQLWLVLVDPATRRRSPPFLERSPPYPNLCSLRDIGGGWKRQSSSGGKECLAVQCGRLICRTTVATAAGGNTATASTFDAESLYLNSMGISSDINLGPPHGGGGGGGGGGGSAVLECHVPSPFRSQFPFDIDDIQISSSSSGSKPAADLERMYAAMATDVETTAGFASFLKCIARVLQQKRATPAAAAAAAIAAAPPAPPFPARTPRLNRHPPLPVTLPPSAATTFGGGGGGHRATWAMAVLLLVLGVPEHEIVADYSMHSKSIAKYRGRDVAAAPAGTAAPATAEMLGRARSAKFLRAGFAAAKALHGSLAKYLTNGLELTNTLKAELEYELAEPV